MAFGKRQLVLAALVVALGAAVYLNWQFSDNRDLLATNTVTSSQKELGEAQYVNNSVSGGDVSSGSDSSDTSSCKTTCLPAYHPAPADISPMPG